MFEDGLHNSVNIYPKVHNTDTRVVKDQLANSKEPAQYNVPCRIIRETKALFQPEIILKSGDLLEDMADGTRYEIIKVKTVYGLSEAHHRSYEIKVKSYGSK